MAGHTISASEVKTLDICPRKWYLGYHRDLGPQRVATYLQFGKLVHRALEAYYNAGRQLNPAEVYRQAWEEDLTPDQEPDIKGRDLGVKLLELYPAWDKEQSDGSYPIVATEVGFEVPVPETDIVLVGRIDLVLRAPNGSLLIYDHKTSKTFPDPKGLMLDKQHGLYMWAAEQHFGEPVSAFGYNHLRKQDPAKARTPVFQRSFFGQNVYQGATYVKDLLWAIGARQRIASLPLEETPSSPGFLCSSCEFFEPCVAIRQLKVGGAEEMLSALYEKRHQVEVADAV